jgi:type IV secretion system protein TrbL
LEFNTLTTTLTNFVGAFQGGYARLQPIVNGLLVALAGIDIVLLGFWWALGGGERLTEVIKKILFLGFWLWFTKSFQSNAKTFVDSLIGAGLTAGGQAGSYNLLLDPSRIAAYGLTATENLAKALDDISITDFGDMIVFGVSYLIIMAAYLIMAIQVFLAVLEYYLITAVAGVLVPWALLPQTKFLAEKAIGAVVSAGIKLMVLAFIIAVANPVLASIHFSGPEIKLNELWSVVLTSGAIAFLSWHAPSVAAGLLAGSPSLGAGAVAQNVASGVMMAAGAAGGMVAATRAAVGAASTPPRQDHSPTGSPSRLPTLGGGGAPMHGASRAVGGSPMASEAARPAPRPDRPAMDRESSRGARAESGGAPAWASSAKANLERQPPPDASPLPPHAARTAPGPGPNAPYVRPTRIG